MEFPVEPFRKYTWEVWERKWQKTWLRMTWGDGCNQKSDIVHSIFSMFIFLAIRTFFLPCLIKPHSDKTTGSNNGNKPRRLFRCASKVLCLKSEQKQPSRGVLRKRCSKNMQQIRRRAPMPKCDPRNLSWELFQLEAATEMYSLEIAIATF